MPLSRATQIIWAGIAVYVLGVLALLVIVLT
jgi:hypothetical protein